MVLRLPLGDRGNRHTARDTDRARGCAHRRRAAENLERAVFLKIGYVFLQRAGVKTGGVDIASGGKDDAIGVDKEELSIAADRGRNRGRSASHRKEQDNKRTFETIAWDGF